MSIAGVHTIDPLPADGFRRSVDEEKQPCKMEGTDIAPKCIKYYYRPC